MQRGEEFEVAYSRKIGSRKYSLSAYREAVRNAALMLTAPDGLYTGGDILPDLFAGSSTFNAGDYQRSGYNMAVTQDLGEHCARHRDVRLRRSPYRRESRTGQQRSGRTPLHDSRRPQARRDRARHGDCFPGPEPI